LSSKYFFQESKMYLECTILAAGAPGILLMHELGHLVVARYFGLTVSSLNVGLGPEIAAFTDHFGTRWKLALLPLGGCCTFDTSTSKSSAPAAHCPTLLGASLHQRAIIYAAGPAFNLAFASVLFLVMFCLSDKPSVASSEVIVSDLAFLIGGFSILVGLFNLLPVLPLDGGRLLLLAMEAFRGRPISETIERRLDKFGATIVAGITIATLVSLLKAIG
jgi:membrane-associated protease RseP (regulator of RpoE activity)